MLINYKSKGESMSDSKYILYNDTNRTPNKITIVNVQDFDLIDYDLIRIIKDSTTGEIVQFDDKLSAIKFLNAEFKREFIDEEYLLNTSISGNYTF